VLQKMRAHAGTRRRESNVLLDTLSDRSPVLPRNFRKASDLMANRMSLPLIIFRSPFRHSSVAESIQRQRQYILKIDFNHLRL